jgi:hypothetical protein
MKSRVYGKISTPVVLGRANFIILILAFPYPPCQGENFVNQRGFHQQSSPIHGHESIKKLPTDSTDSPKDVNMSNPCGQPWTFHFSLPPHPFNIKVRQFISI